MSSSFCCSQDFFGGRIRSLDRVSMKREYSSGVNLESEHAEKGHGFSAVPCATMAYWSVEKCFPLGSSRV